MLLLQLRAPVLRKVAPDQSGVGRACELVSATCCTSWYCRSVEGKGGGGYRAAQRLAKPSRRILSAKSVSSPAARRASLSCRAAAGRQQCALLGCGAEGRRRGATPSTPSQRRRSRRGELCCVAWRGGVTHITIGCTPRKGGTGRHRCAQVPQRRHATPLRATHCHSVTLDSTLRLFFYLVLRVSL